ncbi:MAG: TrkA C-terminal domain-containing protein [bacterium]
MNLILFFIVIVVSFIIVRIGAVAFELTGLEWSLAKFQALSCFTGTGFTTKEAELITSNPQRRRVASILMVMGNAGLISLIATFANSLRTDTFLPQLTMPFFTKVFKGHFPAQFVHVVDLFIIVSCLFMLIRILTHTKLAERFNSILRSNIIRKRIIKPVSFEELVVATGGYGVSSIEILSNSPILDKTIIEAELRSYDINILAVEREGRILPNPSADMKLLLADKLICFGRLDNIREKLYSEPDKQAETKKPEEQKPE